MGSEEDLRNLGFQTRLKSQLLNRTETNWQIGAILDRLDRGTCELANLCRLLC